MMAMLSSLMAVLSLLLFNTNVTNAQFVAQPPAGLLFVPEIGQVTLSCSVDEEFRVNWEVRINGVPLEATRLIYSATFEQRGFNFSEVASTSSTVSFDLFDMTGNPTNNETVITCIAQQGISSPVRGNEVQVIFYRAPTPPINLNVAVNELGSLNISWSLEFIEGVPVNYTLTVLNLNITSAQPIIIAGLLDQHYMFETSRPCDVYSFTVTAVTAAGNSTPSQELIFTRGGNSEVCSATTPERTATVTTATSVSNSQDLSDGVISGMVIGIFIVIITTFVIIFGVWKIISAKRQGVNNVGHQSQQLEEMTLSQQQGVTVPFMQFDCEDPEGVTTFDKKVLLVEKKKKGITIFEDLEHKDFLQLDRADLSEVIVHTETGNMFITTGATGKLLKLSSTGKLINSIENFEFSNGLCINHDRLHVCDSGNHQIKVFDLNLNLLKTIPDNEKKCKPFQTPRDVDFDEHDNIYVAESRRIQVLSPDGNFIRMIGEGKIIDAISLKITENHIFVTNFGEACVSIFSTDGQHIQDFSKDHNLYDRPLSISVDKDYIYFSTFRGKLYICKNNLQAQCITHNH